MSMRFFSLFIIYILSFLLISASDLSAFDLGAKVHQFRLQNGMRWLIVRRDEAPVFAGVVEVKAGGADEEEGKTGIAHMLEHMLFKGSSKIGTRDFKAESRYLKEIERLGDEYKKEQLRARSDPQRLKELEKKIFENLKEERKYIVPNELWEIFQRNGAENLNAYTSKDITTFHAEMPASKLELWAYLISSMLFENVPREFYAEKNVVLEERRNSIDNSPYGRAYEAFLGAFFKGTPYEWPTIGRRQDIEKFSVRDVIDFYKARYAPEKMVGAIVGDVDIAAAKSIIWRYFNRPHKGAPISRQENISTSAGGGERVVVRFPAEPFVEIAYHKPTLPSEDDYVFDVVYYLLCDGKTSRLYKSLVTDRKIAAGVECTTSAPGVRFDNAFMIIVHPLKGHRLGEIEKAVYSELERLKKEPVSENELEKIRNQVNADFLWGLKSNFGLAHTLAFFELLAGDWRYILTHSKKVEGIGADDIMSVAQRYFIPENRIVVILKR